MKFLIDECLSSTMIDQAVDRGHVETTSVVRRGLSGTADWDLMPILIADNFTLVTKNSYDFRGDAANPGEKGLYKNEELHAGLICLNGPLGMDLNLQKALFDIALDEIAQLEAAGRDLFNRCLEVTWKVESNSAEVTIYDIPK